MPYTATQYNKLLSGITDGSINYAAHQINNYTNLENTTDSLCSEAEKNAKFRQSIERDSYIKFFDDTKVSTGANTITIADSATTLYDFSGDVDVTGWGSSGSINVSSISGNGIVWAIYPGLTYTATSNSTLVKPSNAYRVGTFTNNAGTVTWTGKAWQGPLSTLNNIWEGNNTFFGQVFNILPPNYHDVRINYTDANTITVLADSRVRSSDNTTDIIFSSDRTCVLNATGANGLDSGTEAANTWYYLYAIYNPTTLTSALLFSTVNESVTGSITLPSGFTKKRQLKFAVRNNASNDILPFDYGEGEILYQDQQLFANNITSSGVWTAYSLASFVPVISKKALVDVYWGTSGSTTATIFQTRPTGSTVTTGKIVSIQKFTGDMYSANEYWQALNASQQMDIYSNNNQSGSRWAVTGYYVTEVK